PASLQPPATGKGRFEFSRRGAEAQRSGQARKAIPCAFAPLREHCFPAGSLRLVGSLLLFGRFLLFGGSFVAGLLELVLLLSVQQALDFRVALLRHRIELR